MSKVDTSLSLLEMRSIWGGGVPFDSARDLLGKQVGGWGRSGQVREEEGCFQVGFTFFLKEKEAFINGCYCITKVICTCVQIKYYGS